MTVRSARPSSSDFRYDIESLRGIAVLAVVCFHCGVTAFAGGFVGVDIFFVLSGYLITSLLVAEVAQTTRINLPGFYARRAKRLLPAFVVMFVATLAAGALVLAPQEISSMARAARGAAVYLSNAFFGRNAADYFAPDVRTNPFLHTWSLAVEEQFYLCWPLLILAGFGRGRSRRFLAAMLAAVTGLSFAICVWTTANMATFAFYQVPARAWEFGLGGLASLFPVSSLRLGPRAWNLWMLVGIGLILLAIATTPEGAGFPGWIALVPTVGTCIALVAGAGLGAQVPRLLRSGPLPALGTLSYSWYLWHWPVLVIALTLLPGLGTTGKLIAASLALGIAAVSYHFVENPIRFRPALRTHPWRVLGVAGAVALLSFALGTATMGYARRLEGSPAMNRIVAAARTDISRIPRKRCTPILSAQPIACEFGDTAATTNIVLFGDSHAMQWFNALERIAVDRHWKLTTLVKSSCPVAAVDIPGKPAAEVAQCNEWRRAATLIIERLHPDLVVASSAIVYLTITGRPPGGSGLTIGRWRDGLRAEFQALTRTGQRVAWIHDTPIPPHDIPSCIGRAIRLRWFSRGMCGFSREVGLPVELDRVAREAGRGVRTLSFVEMTDQFCDERYCPAMQDGEVVYHDDSHLTGAMAEHLAPVLATRLPVLNQTAPAAP